MHARWLRYQHHIMNPCHGFLGTKKKTKSRLQDCALSPIKTSRKTNTPSPPLPRSLGQFRFWAARKENAENPEKTQIRTLNPGKYKTNHTRVNDDVFLHQHSNFKAEIAESLQPLMTFICKQVTLTSKNPNSEAILVGYRHSKTRILEGRLFWR